MWAAVLALLSRSTKMAVFCCVLILCSVLPLLLRLGGEVIAAAVVCVREG